MKLLNKNTRYLIILIPIILLTCSIVFFFLLKKQIHHLQKEQLFLKQQNVLNKFRDKILDISYSVPGEYDIEAVGAKAHETGEIISDTLLLMTGKNGATAMLPFRKLAAFVNHNGKIYKLTTYVSEKETSHLFIMIFGTQAIIYLILLTAILIINRILSKKLWRPFYDTLLKLGKYDIHKNETLQLSSQTGITEFNQLNKVTGQLILRNQEAFQSQQQFVENASHEIQTPLAIIRSKVELLMEEPAVNEKIASLVAEIAESNDRLSRLNNTLLLFSKIDNNQFIKKTDILLSELLISSLERFEKQMIELPEIRKDIRPDVHLHANQVLIEILIGNLISNAVVHNAPNGFIDITLSTSHLAIVNSGPELTIKPSLLFERFRKGDDQYRKSSGLGLALVKHICDFYGYKVDYEYQDKIHTLTVIFR